MRDKEREPTDKNTLQILFNRFISFWMKKKQTKLQKESCRKIQSRRSYQLEIYDQWRHKFEGVQKIFEIYGQGKRIEVKTESVMYGIYESPQCPGEFAYSWDADPAETAVNETMH